MSDYLQIPFVNEIYLEAVNNGPGGYPVEIKRESILEITIFSML